MDEMTARSQGWRGSNLASCDVSDACDELAVLAVRTGALRPMWPGCPTLTGIVRTVRLEPVAGAASPLPDLLELLADSRGMVLLVDLGGRTDCQAWGTVLSTAARRFGLLGALVNGCMRDVDEVGALGFPAYARGVYPGAMAGRLGLAAIDDPVEIAADEVVEPATLVIADSSGAIFLPAAVADDVADVASARRERELLQLEQADGGTDPRVALGLEAKGKQQQAG